MLIPTIQLKLKFNAFGQQDLNANSSYLQSWLLQSSGQPPCAECDPEHSSSVLAPAAAIAACTLNQPARADAGNARSVALKHHFAAAAKGMQSRDCQLFQESSKEINYAVPKIHFFLKIPACQREKPSKLN